MNKHHPSDRADRLRLKKSKNRVYETKQDRLGHISKKLAIEKEVLHDIAEEVPRS